MVYLYHPRKETDVDKIIRIHLPPKLHAALKVKAARDGTDMQKLVVAAIKALLGRTP